MNGARGTPLGTRKEPNVYAVVRIIDPYGKDIEMNKLHKLRRKLKHSILIIFSELNPRKGDQIRTRKVLVDGAGGSVCLKQDEKENKVCEPCVQEGKLI